MPKTTKSTKTQRTHTRNHAKRHGKHHKKKGGYVKIYAPYLPLIISIVLSMFISFWHPSRPNTLAYATNMSIAGLHASTNVQRANNGKTALRLNAKLSNAAQAKANHMVTHNYWAHTTPDGQEPWVFIQSAGYAYNKAGENLAYGFATSTDAVTGWMNSPTHKANMLDGAFQEVGFGFADSSNFNGDGKQTVVVAMYGQPQVLASTAPANKQDTPAPPTAAEPTPSTADLPVSITQSNEKPPKNETKKSAQTEEKKITPITTEQPVMAAAPISQNISKVQTLTNGQTPWAFGAALLVTGLATIIMLMRYSLKVRALIKDLIHDTEKFVLHNPFLDSLLLGLIILGTALSRTAGTIL